MPYLVAVMGPTASGKSDFAEALATLLHAQLINADAFHVYRGLDIGTNKPHNRTLYRLLDLKDANESFGLGEWIALALIELEELYASGRNVVLVGGTGLYIRALLEEWSEVGTAPSAELRERLALAERDKGLEGLIQQLCQLDPGGAQAIDLNNPVRVRRALEKLLEDSPSIQNQLPPFTVLKVGLNWSTEILWKRIEERTNLLLASGWPEEVEELLASGARVDGPGFRAIGYTLVARYLQGLLGFEDLLLRIAQQTRQYAKRQRTWLRSEPGLLFLDCKSKLDIDPQRAVDFLPSGRS